MALMGSIIKKALDLNQQFQTLPADGEALQRQQLRSLLEKASSTAFGKYYGFDAILQADDPVAVFQQELPIHDYGAIHRGWWRQQQNLPDITWPGRPRYFALSSGTTSQTSKRIPVTDDMLKSFRTVGQAQAAALANYDLPAEYFEKDVLMLSSSADLTPHKQHLEGEISGINSANIPNWFERFYKPGKAIAKIDDWDQRVAAIVKKAPDWDVVAVAGIPSWVRLMLQRIVEAYKLRTIHEIWPDFSIYASGGVAFEPHRKSFEVLLDRPLIIMDTYLASEGFFAFTARPGTLAMRLAIAQNMFYEFIPFDERGFDEAGNLRSEPEVLHIGQVEENQEYALVVSTPAGAWRYFLEDTIRFTDLDKYEMVITGRTKYFLNVVGSQLSEEKLNRGIQELADGYGMEINEFGVAAVKESGEYIHQWVIGTEAAVDERELADRLDKILQKSVKNYAVARQKALREVRVKATPAEELYAWLESRKQKGGQIKFPKVMKADTMRELLEFLEKENV